MNLYATVSEPSIVPLFSIVYQPTATAKPVSSGTLARYIGQTSAAFDGKGKMVADIGLQTARFTAEV